MHSSPPYLSFNKTSAHHVANYVASGFVVPDQATGKGGVWAAAVAKLIVVCIFMLGWKFIHIPPLSQIKQKQEHTASQMIWQGGSMQQTGGVGGSKRPADCFVILWRFPLFFTTFKIYAFLPPTHKF